MYYTSAMAGQVSSMYFQFTVVPAVGAYPDSWIDFHFKSLLLSDIGYNENDEIPC